MAQPQPLTHHEGIVTHANDRGIRLNSEPVWLNVSRFRPVELPPVGAHVAVDVQGDGWLAAVTVLDAQDAHRAPERAVQPRVDRDRTITRLAVLKAAAAFAASRPDAKSPDVLTVADAWLRWVEGGEEA